MYELVRIIEEYKIFNYLVPGIITSVLIGDGGFYSKIQAQDALVEFFAFYFVGLIVSRIGSLVVEEIFKRMGFVQFATYKDFISASSKDGKIEKFSQENNMFRTFTAAFALVFITNLIYRMANIAPDRGRESSWFLVLIIALTLLMAFAYRKQTSYVVRRIKLQK